MATISLVAIVLVYYIFDPMEHGWMPKCPSKLISGYDCPACGSQRMLHAALHGNFATAWRFNPFVFISIPYFLMAAWGSAPSLPWSAKVRSITHTPLAAWAYITLFFAWWIIRNI